MTKLDIINQIVDTTGIAKKDATVAVESFMKVVRDAMCDGENVYLRGHGTEYPTPIPTGTADCLYREDRKTSNRQ